MRPFILLCALVASSCATTAATKSAKCPEKPYCLTALKCTVDRDTGCEVCQCDRGYVPSDDDPRRRPGDPR